MKKEKIAISLDKPLLDIIDSKIDGSIIRSRSQAIENFIRKGLEEDIITYGVVFLKGEHQKFAVADILSYLNQLEYLILLLLHSTAKIAKNYRRR